MKLVAAGFALVALMVPFAVGCAASEDEGGKERSWDPEITADGKTPGKSGGSCAAATCTSLAKTCGTHDDGCGGTVACGGACVQTACTPKTCTELAKTCGKQDDACGGIVDCGVCETCAPDGKESNNSPDKATDLGAMTDSPDSERSVPSLSLGEGDEDWFKFTVTDGGFGGNPLIEATATGGSVEVSVFFMCTSATNFSTCPNAADTKDGTIGMGCRGKGASSVSTECTGLSESGIGYVRVRKLSTSAAGQCISYALGVKVS